MSRRNNACLGMTLPTTHQGQSEASDVFAGFRPRRVASLAMFALVATGLAGCGMGALPSSNNGPVTGSIAAANMQIVSASTGISEIHSTNCPGLEIERQERLRRIATLQAAVANELKNPPTTIAHAMKRASDTPEEGTVAYGEIMAERAYLSSIATAGARLGCPPVELKQASKSP